MTINCLQFSCFVRSARDLFNYFFTTCASFQTWNGDSLINFIHNKFLSWNINSLSVLYALLRDKCLHPFTNEFNIHFRNTSQSLFIQTFYFGRKNKIKIVTHFLGAIKLIKNQTNLKNKSERLNRFHSDRSCVIKYLLWKYL